LLGSSLLPRLLAAGVLVAVEGGVQSRVPAVPFGDRVYLN
jgi:hypothetical protein